MCVSKLPERERREEVFEMLQTEAGKQKVDAHLRLSRSFSNRIEKDRPESDAMLELITF